VYQPIVRGSYDDRTTRMFDEVAMTEQWDSVGTTEMAGTHKAQEVDFGWV
jgi:hypothetical protein